MHNNIKNIAQGIISNNCLNEQITKFQLIEDKDLNKKYDVYYVITNNDKYIFKKSKCGYEAKIYETLFNKIDVAVPKYYGKTTDLESNTWFLLEYISGDSFLNESLENYCNVATQLAIIHSKFINIVNISEKYEFLRNKNENIINKINGVIERNKNYKAHLSDDILNGLKYIANRLSKSPNTIIQNDLLPINIISNHGKPFVIDWEVSAIGCYADDIGRLLGDFKNDAGEKWVSSEWENAILKSYFSTLSRTSVINLSMDEFLLDYQCSKVLNYAEIVFAHILNDWDFTDWYKLNFEAMVNGLNEILKNRK